MKDFSAWLTIEELAAGYRGGDFTAVAVTGAMLDRIDDKDPTLHPYLTVHREAALAAAARADADFAAGIDRGPLQGVPIALKDLCDLEGQETRAGTRVLVGNVAQADSTVAARLKAAGSVILGKLAMTEGAYIAHHPDYEVPVNPWAADRWAGVSSSGSGVATAAGLCFGSLGSDTGGSIRMPSSVNGVVGIKPTYGRVSRHGIFPMAASLDHVGPMTRSVRDAALMLQVIAGRDDADPTSLSTPLPDFLVEAEMGCKGLRIGIDERWITEGMDAEVSSAVLAAAQLLSDEGSVLRPVSMPDTRELSLGWAVTCGTELAVAHGARGLFPEHADDYGQPLRELLEAGMAFDARAYAAVHEQRLVFSGALAALFERVDVLLCPGFGIAVPEANPEALVADIEVTEKILRFTAPFNFSGSPSITMPCGLSRDGLPQGLQLVGRHDEEALLVRTARTYERVGVAASKLRAPAGKS
jgi:amidase